MGSIEGNENRMDHIINISVIKKNWFLFVPVLVMLFQKMPDLIRISEIEEDKLSKKIKLLNRIKGYMLEEEQGIVHRAEMVLHIILKLKGLFEISQLQKVETKYHALSFEDKKRYMLMDIAEFVEDEKREVIHRAIELNLKTNMMGSKLKEIQELGTEGITIEAVEKYIELFEPLLEGEIKAKSHEMKTLMGMLKLVKSMEKKKKIDEMDIIQILQPFVSEEQKESLTKMVQILKVISSMGNEEEKSLLGAAETPIDENNMDTSSTEEDNQLKME
ncbi:hypothetical protein [Alkaliphilus serpentinus]|uniref:Uncharacterized protein n=1 Tax=Alkaliphilus serpentinus TaxID=1482731 RepID=A0A833HN13_9FIRM|nr:hypothetical protein [Alkaliphilus serpentinus]KAB3529026.1 hypothetical protein F8153_10235 [Alkaliphilus serpentinus]